MPRSDMVLGTRQGRILGTPTLKTIRLWGCRATYEALFITIVGISSMTLKLYSCDHSPDSHANGTQAARADATYLCNESGDAISDAGIADAVVSTLLLTAVFHFATRYMLFEKTQNPSFRYFDVFNVVFHITKAVLSAITTIFGRNPIFVLVVYSVCFILLGASNYKFQPCLGRGRVVNNMRAVLFFGGAYISMFGVAMRIKGTDSPVGVSFYVIFALVLIFISYFVWSKNDARPESGQFSNGLVDDHVRQSGRFTFDSLGLSQLAFTSKTYGRFFDAELLPPFTDVWKIDASARFCEVAQRLRVFNRTFISQYYQRCENGENHHTLIKLKRESVRGDAALCLPPDMCPTRIRLKG